MTRYRFFFAGLGVASPLNSDTILMLLPSFASHQFYMIIHNEHSVTSILNPATKDNYNIYPLPKGDLHLNIPGEDLSFNANQRPGVNYPDNVRHVNNLKWMGKLFTESGDDQTMAAEFTQSIQHVDFSDLNGRVWIKSGFFQPRVFASFRNRYLRYITCHQGIQFDEQAVTLLPFSEFTSEEPIEINFEKKNTQESFGIKITPGSENVEICIINLEPRDILEEPQDLSLNEINRRLAIEHRFLLPFLSKKSLALPKIETSNKWVRYNLRKYPRRHQLFRWLRGGGIRAKRSAKKAVQSIIPPKQFTIYKVCRERFFKIHLFIEKGRGSIKDMPFVILLKTPVSSVVCRPRFVAPPES